MDDNLGFGSHAPARPSAVYTPLLFPTDAPFPWSPSPDNHFAPSNAPGTATHASFFIGTRQDQPPLADLFTRLNLSSGVAGGSSPAAGDRLSGGYGFLPLPSQGVLRTDNDFHTGSSLCNGIATLGGEVGLGSLQSRDDFLGFSNSAPVVYEPSSESGKRGFGVERLGCPNQSPGPRQYPSQELCSLYSIMHRPSQNRLLRGPAADSYVQVDAFVSPENSRAAPCHRNLDSHFNHQLQHCSLEDWRGSILPLAMNQHGCRFLQEKIQNLNVEEIELIFSEVINHVAELMLDQFGNYIVQKLVEFCNEEQRTRILLSVTKNQYRLIFICLNIHGTRVMQRLLEHLTTSEQVSIAMSALSPITVALTMDASGHHVIEHCLKLFSFEDNMVKWSNGEKYLVKEVVENCFEIATDRSGCCVLQSCVEHSQGELRKQLMAEIVAHALPLAEDRFGNYVVQHLMGLRIPEVMINIRKQFEGALISLSCNKYGSNVVQRLLDKSEEEVSSQVIIDLLQSPNVSRLLLDPFGNFVFQSALSESKGVVRNALVSLVRLHAPSMRSNLYGKKILHWFDKRRLQHLYM